MNVLIVAHPDDEILWFPFQDMDHIVIAFTGRDDRPEIVEGRKRMKELHPLKDKITYLDLHESNYWRDKSRLDKHIYNYASLSGFLERDSNINNAARFYTHNPWGEYKTHSDHILVHQAVMAAAQNLKTPVFCFDGIEPQTARLRMDKKVDLDLFREIKQLYINSGCWTWAHDYEPQPVQFYFQANEYVER